MANFPEGLEKYYPSHLDESRDKDRDISLFSNFNGFYNEKGQELSSRTYEERQEMYSRLTAQPSSEFVHYWQEGPLEFNPNLINPHNNPYNKPDDVYWASPVDSKDSWKEWSKREDYMVCSERDATYFKVAEDSRVLVVETPVDLYCLPWKQTDEWNIRGSNYMLDYEQMKRDGIDGIEVKRDATLNKSPLHGFDVHTLIVLNPRMVEIERDKGLYAERDISQERSSYGFSPSLSSRDGQYVSVNRDGQYVPTSGRTFVNSRGNPAGAVATGNGVLMDSRGNPVEMRELTYAEQLEINCNRAMQIVRERSEEYTSARQEDERSEERFSPQIEMPSLNRGEPER